MKETSNEDLFLTLPRRILKFFGVWLPPKKYLFFHYLYMCLVMTTQYSFLIFELIYLVDVISDLDAASEASYLLFTQASLCYKTTVFLINKKILADILDFMKQDLFTPQSPVHEQSLKKLAKIIIRLCTFFMISALSTTTLWGMIPLFDSAAGTRIFPFKIWMPIGTDKSPHYEIGYLYQVVTIYISAFLFIAVDSAAVSMIMFSCGQLDIVIDKLKKMEAIPHSTKAITKVELLDYNFKILKEIIQHHQAIVSYVGKVESTFHANIFFQLSGSVAIICITGLRISIVDHKSVQFMSMVNYMVTMLSQLFLYCWCGNELTIRSLRLLEALYECPWYEQDTKFNRCLLITMRRMTKPIIFRAGHYIPLSRQTFVTILKSSYSYFAVLNQSKGK